MKDYRPIDLDRPMGMDEVSEMMPAPESPAFAAMRQRMLENRESLYGPMKPDEEAAV